MLGGSLADLNRQIVDLNGRISSLSKKNEDAESKRQQAEADLLIVTRGIELNTRKANTQLAGMNKQEQQRADAINRQMLLQQLGDIVYKFRTDLDLWQKADSEARAKSGPRGKADPTYISQRNALQNSYNNKLSETMRSAKYLYEQLRRSVPEAKNPEMTEDSPLSKAASGQEINTDNLRKIIYALSEAYRKASAVLPPPLADE